MGLFRRGTQLLKLGSSLRDCCCRPEQPEECFCPDWCRYYWDWGGGLRVPSGSLMTQSPCDYIPVEDGAIAGSDVTGAYGVGTEILPQYFVYKPNPRVAANKQGTIELSYNEIMDFQVSEADADTLFPVKCPGYPGIPNVSVRYRTFFRVVFSCEQDQSSASFQLFFAELTQEVVANSGYSCQRPLFLSYKSTSGLSLSALASSCSSSPLLTCDGQPSSRRHVDVDVEVSVGDSGVIVAGTTYPWASDFSEQDNAVAWQVSGEYPLSNGTAPLTLRRLSSCQPNLPCDCTTSIVGRSVIFEGRTFTIGDLDTILGTSIEHDGQSYWEEVSTGSFRRTDYEVCDGTYVARVKTATVSCSTFDGVEKWFVILDHKCYDRDPATCPPSYALKEAGWTGVYNCTGTGAPVGLPNGASGFGDPDLDYSFTSGTPAHRCVDDLAIPFLSFYDTT